MTIIVDGLLMTDRCQIGELGRCQSILSEVIVKEHGRRVTISGTTVNTLLTDSDKRFVYPWAMKYPNRLAEIMDRDGVDGPTLARAANTTKQQILKLRKGERDLDRDWGQRFERTGLLKASWPEIMGWRNPSSLAEPETQRMLKIIGLRIGWARSIYRMVDVSEAASRFGMSTEHLSNIESGTDIMTVPEIIEISTKLQVPLGFLLQGLVDDLPHKAALEWEAYRRGLLSLPPAHTG